jgi:hypothetical protein
MAAVVSEVGLMETVRERLGDERKNPERKGEVRFYNWRLYMAIGAISISIRL